jgi:hypothetical protein
MPPNRVGSTLSSKKTTQPNPLDRMVNQQAASGRKRSSASPRSEAKKGAPTAPSAGSNTSPTKAPAVQPKKPDVAAAAPRVTAQAKTENNPFSNLGSAIQNFFMPKAHAMPLNRDDAPASSSTNTSTPQPVVPQANRPANGGGKGAGFAPGAAPKANDETKSSAADVKKSSSGHMQPVSPEAKAVGVKTAQDLFSAAVPDAIVLTNGAARSGDTKNFALIGANGSVTHFINHAGKTRQTPVGTLSRVEGIHYSLVGGGTRREDGGGISKPFELKGIKGTFFFNTRVGDTNAHHATNGISANAGAFFPLSQAKALVDKMPNNAKTAAFKKTLEGAVAVAKSTDTQVGFAYRGTLEYDTKAKQTVVVVSGVRVPLTNLTKPDSDSVQKPTESTNEGKKPIARANNEEAYTNGANPFERADQTGAKTGGYLNHGDRVADIAADVRQWQNKVEGPNAKPVRSNADAARVLETAVERSESTTPEEAKKHKQIADGLDISVRNDALSRSERQQLTNTLLKLDKQGQYFGSDKVKAAAREARQHFGDSNLYSANKPSTKSAADQATEAQFTREVFQGKFRKDAVHQYNLGDGVRDAAVFGLNRFVAAAATVFDAAPLSDGTMPVAKMARESQGFSVRMASQGSTMQQLGLGAKGRKVDAATDARATEALNTAMSRRLTFAGKPVSAQAKYDAFKALTPAEKQAVAAEVRSTLNRR